MTFISKGVGLGEIHVNLKVTGVAASDEQSLKATIRGLREVVASSVVIDDGWLKCQVKAGQLQREKLDEVLTRLESRIVGICQHKAEFPGRGIERRPSKDRFINDPRLIAH
ncbi:MAG: hypothetical protein ACREGF_01885 [Candidatus Saccharimonadales bacterium]